MCSNYCIRTEDTKRVICILLQLRLRGQRKVLEHALGEIFVFFHFSFSKNWVSKLLYLHVRVILPFLYAERAYA